MNFKNSLIFYIKSQQKKGFYGALAALLFITSIAQGQLRPKSFWDDVDLEASVGVNNFHGDFDRLNGTSGDKGGVPFPIEGFHVNIGATKDLNVLSDPKYQLKATFNLEYTFNRSESISTGVPVDVSRLAVVPVNMINKTFGTIGGVSFEYRLNDRFSIEPFLGLSIRLHNPQTDGFVSSINTADGSVDLTVPGGDLGDPPFDLEDFPATRLPTDDEITNGVAAGSFGFKLSRQFIGNYRWFIKYTFLQFFDDMIDNTSEASTRAGGPDDNDSMTLLSVGLSYPLLKDKRRSEEVTPDVRLDPARIEKIERIQNMVNLITTDEDLRQLRELMSDKILLYDTPGVRFNELASKTESQMVELNETGFKTEMVSIPSGSYIMGLNAVDELNIQPQGKKRITINPFMIDKFEVTNREYRIFLTAIGALEVPQAGSENADPAITDLDYANSQMSMEELISEAKLDDYTLHVPRPTLDTVEDLLPDSTKWREMGLEDVVPWNTYFKSEFYADYPVVCVNWYEAKLYAAWAGKRLPTESEWEFAARSGISGRIFPWDGLEVQTNTGKYKANFKQGRGIYQADGFAITAPVSSFVPNDFELYNMAGNVSEWVLDSYNPSYVVLQNVGTANFVTPSYTNVEEPRKVHRGGSWQSTEFFIGVGVRNFQVKTEGTPFIGFRTAKNIQGRGQQF